MVIFMSGFRDIGDKVIWPLCLRHRINYFSSYNMVYVDLIIL